MSKVRLYGDTSGYVDLKAPDVANDVTITLPNETGPFATENYVDTAVTGLATETYVDNEIAAIPEIAGIGSNVSFRTGTMSQSVSGGSYVDLSGVYVTITPTSATSKVLVFAQIGGGIEHGSGTDLRINATSGSASPQLLQTYDAVGRIDLSFFVGYLMSPATTSAVTYQVQVKKGGVFRYRWSMWAIEVAA